ncbi:MAG: L-lactate dehydrogenase, partial [Clostridia bacterium]|nr:L-lactate dehydrogenase [Clostridia bacterium]
SIIPKITAVAPNAVYIIVSNPVDILTYVFCKCSGLPERQIIGTGCLLDTARLRSRLAENFSISMQNVHCTVMGEHGDTSFIPWSLANISGSHVDTYAHDKGLIVDGIGFDHDEIENYVRKSGATIIDAKGATYYAVSLTVNHIVRCLTRGIDTALSVSTMMHGEYGIEDVCLSILSIVGEGGLNGKLISPLTDEEVAKLRHSAETLKGVISSLKI